MMDRYCTTSLITLSCLFYLIYWLQQRRSTKCAAILIPEVKQSSITSTSIESALGDGVCTEVRVNLSRTMDSKHYHPSHIYALTGFAESSWCPAQCANSQERQQAIRWPQFTNMKCTVTLRSATSWSHFFTNCNVESSCESRCVNTTIQDCLPLPSTIPPCCIPTNQRIHLS